VRDGCAERRLGAGPIGIDMDPLVIAGRIRKRVDAVLRDQEPAARRDLAPDQSGEVRQCDDGHAGSPWKPRPSIASF
jgi:hypothetical protein